MLGKIRGVFEKIFGKKEADEDDREADVRVRISQAQQQMMFAVAGASIVFGICLVLSIHFVRSAFFYSRVLTEEDKTIDNYESSIINSGACAVSAENRDKGTISDAELDACEPDMTPLSGVPDSLRANVTLNMAQNKNLESVARDYVKDCYTNGDKSKPINYTQKYEESDSAEDRDLYLLMIKICSSLRVIPDALPAAKNEEALMASLNKIFILSKWDPESLAPGDSGSIDTNTEALGSIPMSIIVNGRVSTINRVLGNVEKSIRTFEPTRGTFSWSSAGIDAQIQASSYYANTQGIIEPIKTVRASDGNKRGGGS